MNLVLWISAGFLTYKITNKIVNHLIVDLFDIED